MDWLYWAFCLGLLGLVFGLMESSWEEFSDPGLNASPVCWFLPQLVGPGSGSWRQQDAVEAAALGAEGGASLIWEAM